MPEMVRIEGNVQWRWHVASGGNYIAVCDPLKITLQSKTWGELVEDMASSLEALVVDLIQSREWDSFMQEHGWTMIGAMPAKPENARFEVPFSITPLKGASHEHGASRLVHQ